MEITWTYNWLETVGFLFLLFFGGKLLLKGIALLWLTVKFKGWW